MAIQKVCHLLLPPSFLQLASDVDKYSRKQRERKEEKSQFMTGLSSSFHLLFAEQRYIVGMKSILKTNAMNALWSAELLLGFDGGANERTAAEQAKKIHVAFWVVVGILYFSKAKFEKRSSLFSWEGFLLRRYFRPVMIKRSIIGSFVRKCILTDHGECRQTLAPPDHQYVYLLFDDFLINVITFFAG